MSIENSLLLTLRAAAAEDPGRECLRIVGESFTRQEALRCVERTARGLRALGVEPGDRVGVMCGNRAEYVWTWLGANAARAVDVPFNAEARGRLLEYFVADASPRVLVGTEDYLQILARTSTWNPEFVVCIGACASRPFGDRCRQLSFEDMLALGAASDEELPDPAPGDIATIMYTSGTTGPSKGVMLPQRSYVVQAHNMVRVMEVDAADVILCVQPLFHIDARAFLTAALVAGGTGVLGRKFSVSRFWDDVRQSGATVFATIGTMLWMLYKQPPRPDDADLPAHTAMCSSTPSEILRGFEKRFGVQVVEAYGMTECTLLTAAPPGSTVPGRVGRAVPGMEIRLVDGHDFPVAPGQAGELVYRPDEPFAMMQGYWAKPAETAEAWRNLWFHTGDLLREHSDGMFEYVGRTKDSIRHRGENVSSWEVEQAASAHPQVLEVAAIGVPSEVGEEDVAVLVVPSPDAVIDPAELVEFLRRDLPRFAVPRYVEVVESLPKTPSERIEKGKVRERGITAACWDAKAVADLGPDAARKG
ncbi:AMP-binding protein [Amycolatopsis nivea]